MFVDQIAAAIESACGRDALDQLSRAIWQGISAGALGDDDAQRLAELIHAKRGIETPGKPVGGRERPASLFPVRKPQRPPVRSVAIERRRRLASSGPLPPSIAGRFTTGELAVLRIVGDECRDRGACMLPLGAIAARAGVCRKLVQNTIRRAKRLGLLEMDERRRPGRPNLTNVVKIVSNEWKAWLARGPRFEGGGGKKFAPTDTNISLRQERGAGSDANPLRPERRRWTENRKWHAVGA